MSGNDQEHNELKAALEDKVLDEQTLDESLVYLYQVKAGLATGKRSCFRTPRRIWKAMPKWRWKLLKKALVLLKERKGLSSPVRRPDRCRIRQNLLRTDPFWDRERDGSQL